jgi:hypothetical protein
VPGHLEGAVRAAALLISIRSSVRIESNLRVHPVADFRNSSTGTQQAKEKPIVSTMFPMQLEWTS